MARFLDVHRRTVLGVAIAAAALAAALGFGVAQRLDPFGADDPATQSVKAQIRYEAAAHRRIEPDVIALVDVGDVASGTARMRVARVGRALARQPGVVAVTSYYSTHDPAMVSADRRQSYLDVYFRVASDRTVQDEAKALATRFAGMHGVTLGGAGVANAQVNSQVSADLAHAELLAFPVIFLLSLLFFRSLVASLLPPLLGGLTIVVTLFALRIASDFVGISVYAVNFTTGIGLGLAIDYSLLMVSRYREEAAVDGFGRPALQRTLRTAGRTITFSAVTVAVSIAALCLFPQEFLYSMGIAGAIAPLLALVLALTVLPALLAVLGPRVNALAPRALARAAAREARPMDHGFWYRLSGFVMNRRRSVAAVAAATLIVLGLPLASIHFNNAGPQELPPGASARQVDTALVHRFPSGRSAPVDVVVGVPAGSPQAASLRGRLAALPDVAGVSAPQPAGASDALLYVFPRRDALSAQSRRLVGSIRALRTSYYLGVTGYTASLLDLESSLGRHLPLVLAIVVLATLVVLFLMTGSVILPVKAVLMNGLTLSAMLGILVWVFQDGHLQGLLGFRSEGALNVTMPVFLAAVGFGLATDYGVFLLGRVKEAHDAGRADREAVSVGLERTGRIVTAAALLFAVAIGAFVTSKIIFIKELGLGAALAVLIDASIVRALLVPSLMAMLGPVNWWAPGPLRRLHARVGLGEGERGSPGGAAAAEAAPGYANA